MDINSMSYFMLDYKQWFLAIHILGIIFGFGGSLISDMLFFKYIKDGKISDQEYSTIKTLAKIIWVGLAIIIISGVLLFFCDPIFYSHSPKFLAKMVIVVVVFINGFFINRLISTQLMNIPFGQFLTSTDDSVKEKRRFIFALGAISTASWWTAFILGWMSKSPISFFALLSLYTFILLVAVVISQVIELRVSKRRFVEQPS